MRALPERTRRAFVAQWDDIRAHAADRPGEALDAAWMLVTSVLRERGWAVDAQHSPAEGLAVRHPDLAADWRTGEQAVTRRRQGRAERAELSAALAALGRVLDALLAPPAPG